MRRRRLTSSAGVLIAALVTLLGIGNAPAYAISWPINDRVAVEKDLGKPSSAPPNAAVCSTLTFIYAHACFVADGDYLYVLDKKADGHSAVALWEDYTANDQLWRQGICHNAEGQGHWVRCNKNFYESHTLAFSEGKAEGWRVLDFYGSFRWVPAA